MAFRAESLPPPDVLAAIRAPFEAFGGSYPKGAAWVEAPVLQPLNLLLDLAGEAMRARLFIVQGEGMAEACLRPDFTIPLTHAHLDSGADVGRYLYLGKAFRTAPPGATRPSEFWQIGAEVYGAPPGAHGDPAVQDAEIAALAWAGALAGGRRDLRLTLGDVGLFAAFLAALDLPQPVQARLARTYASGRGLKTELGRMELARTDGPRADRKGGRLAELLSDLPEGEAAGVLEELWKLAGIQPVGGRAPAEIVHRLSLRAEAERNAKLSPAEADLIGRYLEISGDIRGSLDRIERLASSARIDFELRLAPWIRRLKALVGAGVPEAAMTLSAGFTRPFGYYDGVLFEIGCPALGPDQPVAAGGRYDGLPARLGVSLDHPCTAPVSAVGCMVRPARAWTGTTADV
jgi:ATP phosphoribosyltransferase regulatory subunit